MTMAIIMKFICIIFPIFLSEIESSRDFLYTDIAEVDVVVDQNAKWTSLRIDLVQYNAPRFFNLLILKQSNIHQEASNIQIPNYLSDVQENFKYKFTLKILDSKSVLQKIIYFIEIRKPRSENGKCHFVDNIYLETYGTHAFTIGIKFKSCLMRYTSFSENSVEAANMQNFFHTYAGGIRSDNCRKLHYKYSPQLKKFLCLCRYNERPCETFIGCVAYGKICSNRGFCVTSEPFSKCSCINHYGSYHCEKTGRPCELTSQCQNDGKCINAGNFSWYCECPQGFKGKSCELKDLCHNYLCFNQGKCNIENGNPKCVCLTGYIGNQCEIELSKCPKCLNNGKCFSPDLGYNYICLCPIGFVGLLCEFRRKQCDGDKVCYNYGKCFKGRREEQTCFCQEKYYGDSCEKYADCPTGYFGPHCRIAHSCLRNRKLCLNSGNCVIVNNHVYLCKCKAGFHGNKCQYRHCTQNSDCLNNGTCELNGSRGACICPLSYTGKFCQFYNECYGYSRCGVNAECIQNRKGKFKKCVCHIGWQGKFCEERIKYDKSEL